MEEAEEVTTEDHDLPEEGGWDHPIRGCHQACRARLRQVLRRKENREKMSWMWTSGVLGVVMQEQPGLSVFCRRTAGGCGESNRDGWGKLVSALPTHRCSPEKT